MKTRRRFFKESLAAGSLMAGALAAPWPHRPDSLIPRNGPTFNDVDDERLKAILAEPVLNRDLLPAPIMIESVDLIKIGDTFVVRARAADGAEGYAVTNWGMSNFWPIFVNHVAPFFTGKDARDLDDLIEACFIDDSHYKMQSMAIWTPIASAEFAILDLLGHSAGRPIHDLLGKKVRPSIDVYWANNFRGQSAEDSVRQIVERYEREKPPAVKVKIAGRMGAPEEPPGRSERMLPMLREALGDDVVIYADANGGYTVEEAVRIGRVLEEIDVGFFEEPCPFYELWETKAVADALDIPIAAGEQESSVRRFRWMVANDGAQVLQPDLFYYGGLIRSIRVARMAEAAGLECTAHVSGGDMNMLYIAHFASLVPNAGPHQEYKSPDRDIPYDIPGGRLHAVSGSIPVPTGPGLGFRLDPDWVASGQTITASNLL